MRCRTVLAILGLFSLAACDDSPVINPWPGPFQVEVTPDSAVVSAGDSVKFSAQVSGSSFFEPRFEWRLIDFRWGDPEPAVSPDGGWVTGRAAGSGLVLARAVRPSSGESYVGPGSADTAAIRVTPGPPWTVTISWSPHGIQEGVSYETASLFETVVSDSFDNPTSAEVYWTSENDQIIAFADGTTHGVAPGTTSVAVGLASEEPEDEAVIPVAPFSGRWADLGVTLTSSRHVCGVDTDGHAACGGSNRMAQLGFVTRYSRSGSGGQYLELASSQRLPVDTDLEFQSIVTGGGLGYSSYTCGLGKDGLAYCWGSLRRTGNTESGAPVCYSGGPGADSPCRAEPLPVREDLLFLEIVDRGRAACGLTETGALWCWTDEVWEAFPATDLRTFDGSEHGGCGLSEEGVAYCWGGNDFGQLGIGAPDTVDHSDPEPVSTDLRFTDVTYHSAHACGIATDQSVYCWGAGGAGQLGTTDSLATCPGPPDGDSAPCSPQPTRVASELSFTRIEAGREFTCGLTVGGEGYCWGRSLERYGTDGPDLPQSEIPAPVPWEGLLTTLDNDPSSVCFGAEGGQIPCWWSL